MKKISKFPIIFLSHSTAMNGPIDNFENYCFGGGHSVFKIDSPLDNYTDRFTKISKDNKITKKIKRKLSAFNIFYDFYLTLAFLRNLPDGKYTIVGANNFDTFTGIFYRFYNKKKVKKVIYFASDYSENRFKNILLNKIYYFIESVVLMKSNLVISNTKRAEKKRIDRGLKSSKSIVIPNGVTLENEVFKKKNIKNDRFIYEGNVTKEHGLLDMINLLEPLINELVVVGGGPEWESLKQFTKNKGYKVKLLKNRTDEEVKKILQEFEGFGLAPYNDKSMWTYYCSPLKVNDYIACGVPVIVSDRPEISDYIKRYELGVVYERMDFSHLLSLLDEFSSKDYYKKAEKFYRKYSHDSLYNKIEL